ncbi:MAG: Ig-like domain repeat protein [Actinomycetota bacterium]
MRNWTVDTLVPGTTIVGGPSGVTADGTPTFTFSSDDPTATFECDLDGGGWSACPASHTLAPLEDGPHTLLVRARDAAGNVDATPEQADFTVDTSAPTTSIDGGPSGPVSDNTPSFNFSSDDPSATFECSVDSGTWVLCTTPHTLDLLSDGPHTFAVRAADTLGNTDLTPATRSFTVDTADPETTINSGPSGLTNSSAATFTFSSDDPGATFECSINGLPFSFTSCVSGVNYTGLAEGDHTFAVRAMDSVGNFDATPATRSFTVDTVAPGTSIDDGPSGTINVTSASFTFSSTDGTATFECQVDSGSWASCTSPKDLTGLTEGPHVLSVRAADPTGNVDPTPASRSFTVDTDRPETTINSGPDGPTNTASPSFTFSSDEPGSTFECQLNSGTWDPCSSPIGLTSLSEGSHIFRVRGIDAGGNVDLSPAVRNFAVDTVAPDTTIDDGPSGPTAGDSAVFTFSSTDAGATFECSVDSGSWNACTSPRSLTGLSEGPHNFAVRAKDTAGNVDASPPSADFTIDTTPPNTQIDSGPTGTVTTDSATYTFSSADVGATFECSVDSGSWTTCISPTDLTGLSEGPHNFAVRAKDAAGNVDPTPATADLTVDTRAPDTTIGSGPSGAIATDDATFGFTADESGVTFECSLDGLPFSPGVCTSPQSYTGLNDGPHTFSVAATDSVGNTDPSPATRSFTVDTTAPETTIDQGPTGTISTNSTIIEFSSDDASATYECNLDGEGWFTCSSPQAVGPLTDGSHTVEVRGTDTLGNVETVPAARTFTVDTGVPDTTITDGPTGTIGANSTSFQFSSNDPSATFECSLDSEPWTSCASPLDIGPLAEGDHSFEVRARDAANNVDPTPAARDFSVDTVTPDTAIDSAPVGTTTSDAVTFTFSSDDGTATFQCSLDSGAWNACTSPHNLTSLGNGVHTFAVRATDGTNTDPTPATETFTVDTEAPDTTIDSGPPAAIATTSTTVEFSSDEPLATFACKLDTGTWTACTSPEDLTGLTEGVHTFAVRATDPFGNTDATPAEVTFTVDTVAPDTSVDGGPQGSIADDSPSFTFSSDDASATFQCSLDGLPFALDVCTSPQNYSSLNEGDHTFAVRAVDVAGNVDATPATRSFTVDTVPPSTTIDSGPSGPTNSSSATFAFSSPDVDATFECRLAPGAWADCTSPNNITSLVDGPYDFEVRAVDPAGNADPTPATSSFTVDTAAPGTTIDSGPSGTIPLDEASFAFSSDDPGATFECSLDSAPFAACVSTVDFVSLSEGPHTFEVRAVDAAGNVDGSPASSSFTVDTNAPNTAIDSGPSGTIATDAASFAFSSGEPTATFECRLDTGAWAACVSPVDLVSLGDGLHTFSVRAKDDLGNADPTPASRSFTVDTTAPETSIDAGPSGAVGTASPSFTFSSDDATATFECNLDAAGWTACTSPEDLAGLSETGHTFEVRAVDPVGNIDASPAARSFTVDLTAPDTAIDSGPSGPIPTDAATFDLSSGDATATFECRLDSGLWDVCTSPVELTTLDDGPHTFEARAVDAAGNVDQSPPSRTFTVDTVAPDTTIDSGPSGPIADASPAFTFSSDDVTATFECRLDTGTWNACTSPHDLTSLSDAAYTFEVRAVDSAGNVDQTPPARTFTVDTVAPETTIDSGPTGPIATDLATFTFSSADTSAAFECDLNNGGWVACTSPLDLGPLADGSYDLGVRAVDAAGNHDQSPATTSFTVDTSAPETTIDSGPSGTIDQDTATVDFSSSDPSAFFECSLDGEPWSTCTSPLDLTSLSEGSHTFSVRAEDGVGNVDVTPAVRDFTVDTVGPPAPTIDSGPSGTVATSNVTFAFSSSEIDAMFECSLDGAAFTVCTSPQVYTGVAEGAHSFEVRAVDTAGNPGAVTQVDFTVDTSPPDGATIDSGPSGFITVDNATFAFSSNDPTDGFECRLDGGTWDPCTSPADLVALDQGEHTFDVRAVDGAGNPQVGFASRTFTVDTVAPAAVVITDGPSGGVSTATVSFTFTGEPNDIFECSLDAQAYVACSSGVVYSSLAEGGHTFEVRALDLAGNVGQPTSRAFEVDTVAPGSVSIDSAPSGTIDTTNAQITFSSADPADEFECSVDGGSFQDCNSPLNLSGLSNGMHTIDVRAVDQVGNRGPISSVVFEVDAGTGSPDPTPTFGPPSPSPSPTPSPSPSATATPSPSATPSPEPSEEPSPTPEPTESPEPKPTKEPKPSPQPSPTRSPNPGPKDPPPDTDPPPTGNEPGTPPTGTDTDPPPTGSDNSGAGSDGGTASVEVNEDGYRSPFSPSTSDSSDDWPWPKDKEKDPDPKKEEPEKDEPKEPKPDPEPSPDDTATVANETVDGGWLGSVGGILKGKGLVFLMAFAFLGFLLRRLYLERLTKRESES